MKIKELKIKSLEELKTLLKESRDQLQEKRFKVAQRQLKNVKEIQTIKKNISQILTLIKEKSKTA